MKSGKILTGLILSLALSMAIMPAVGRASGRWITIPQLDTRKTVVLHFRRDVELTRVEKTFQVKVSSDNRFILYVNGRRVGQGPARGDLKHWRYEVIDIAPYLRKGHNVLAAEVWNAVKDPTKPGLKGAPMAQITARTAFWLEGPQSDTAVDTDNGWRVAVQPGHDFSTALPGFAKALKNVWYAAGGSETIDGAQADWNWKGDNESSAQWVDVVDAVAAGDMSPWTLEADQLPAMAFTSLPTGKLVSANQPTPIAFPKKILSVPANTELTFLLDQGEMVSAYPEMTISGGKGAKVTLTYAEALYDEKNLKGDRDVVTGRKVVGLSDTFLPDGGAQRKYRPLWWRTWRYLQVTVKTDAKPIVLEALGLHGTGYPFQARGSFRSSDPELNKIWDIGWRTLKVDAHETFMDSSYWEQLQYVGDTRLENLISYSVAGDPRLAVQAIDAFGHSARADGMIESAYPSNSTNIIPPFGLLWIGMIHDYWMAQPDTSVVTRNLAGTRKILDWYAPYVAENGLLKRNPEWNFVDWVNDPPLARDKFPSFDKVSGTSCLTSLLYLGALQQAAQLERAVGDATLSRQDVEKSEALTAAIRRNCWDETRGLYADDPSKTIFSQHANALAVLYDVAPAGEAAEILSKVTTPQGIEAPQGILESSYYFSWYLIHAFEHAGLGDRYLDQLATWRDLLKLNYTTWPEQRGNTRSDTHAWSAHPTADLLGIVAGIKPGSPGFGSVRVAPQPGNLKFFDAVAATPRGMVEVHYKRVGPKTVFRIVVPEGLPGELVWAGRSYRLKAGNNRIVVKAAAGGKRQ